MHVPDFKLAIFHLQCSEFSNAWYLAICRHCIKLHYMMSHPIVLKDVTILLSSPLGIHHARNVKEIKMYSVEELMK